MDRSEPVARCAWCVELNPLSANYCQHCGHEAHTTRAACNCLACRAGVEVCIHCGFSRLAHDEVCDGRFQTLLMDLYAEELHHARACVR